MKTSTLRTVLHHVRKIAGKPSGAEDRDAELLDRFIKGPRGPRGGTEGTVIATFLISMVCGKIPLSDNVYPY